MNAHLGSPVGFEPDVMRTAPVGTSLTTFAIVTAAWRRGLEVSLLDPQMRRYQISSPEQTIDFDVSSPSLSTDTSVEIVNDKWETISYLRAAGVPVAPSMKVDLRSKELTSASSVLGFPLVLKPLAGAKGKGVVSNLRDAGELAQARNYLLHELEVTDALAEAHFPGEDLRVLVVNGEVIAAFRRKPATVTGDGHSTVQELIDAEAQRRSAVPSWKRRNLRYDREVASVLERQGLSLSSVPRRDQGVKLREVVNASAGGAVEDVTESLSRSLKQTAIRAIEAIPGLSMGGVDFLVRGPLEAEPTEFVVLEINQRPQIDMHITPLVGRGRNVPDRLIDLWFPEAAKPVETDRRVVLDLYSLLKPLREGAANRVVARPYVPGTVQVYKEYEVAVPRTLGPLSKRQTLRRAADLNIFGGASFSEGKALIQIAGGRRGAEKFATEIFSRIEGEVIFEREVKGLVKSSFRIS